MRRGGGELPEGPGVQVPIPFNDAWASTWWVAAHAEELGADPSRIAVGGDSAGGNLAAAVTIRARQEGGPALAKNWAEPLAQLARPPGMLANADQHAHSFANLILSLTPEQLEHGVVAFSSGNHAQATAAVNPAP